MRTSIWIKVLIGILLGALVGVLAGCGIYLKQQSEQTTYFPGTSINGYDVSGQTPEQVCSDLLQKYSAPHISLEEGGETAIEGSLADFGYTINDQSLLIALQADQQQQRNNVLTMIESLLSGGSFQEEIPFLYDRKVLEAKVNAAALPKERTSSVDAEMKFDKTKSEYYIEPEVYGNEFSDADLQDFMENAINGVVSGGAPGSDLTVSFPTDLYYLPEITKDDISLNNLVNLYNQYSKAKITYVFGSQKEVVDWSTIQNWVIIDNGTASLDEEAMYEYVVDLAYRYNTRYYDRTFNTSIGTTITIPGDWNTYGYTVDEDAEYSQLYADVLANTSTEREPVYYETTADGYATPLYWARDGRDDLAGTYVEANLTMQHLWFYVDGGLVVESDFVSGDVSRQHETNTGVFPLAYKESPSKLSGDDGPNGYEVEVKYWMPFSDGQGLHDASWRGAFGGQIYVTGGSHGCINLPESAAAQIYSYIQPGMAIIVYK